jgi:hypothetical protein
LNYVYHIVVSGIERSPVMKKRGLTLLLILLPFMFHALDVDVDELQSQDDHEIEYFNYSGEHEFFNTAEEIFSIGIELDKDRRFDGAEGSYGNKYSILRIPPQRGTESRGADILYLFSDSRVDHIDNIRRILTGYLMEAFAYSQGQAFEIARQITIYNTVLRGRIDYFSSRYSQEVVQTLRAEQVGLARSYSEWAGSSSIVIPVVYTDSRGSGAGAREPGTAVSPESTDESPGRTETIGTESEADSRAERGDLESEEEKQEFGIDEKEVEEIATGERTPPPLEDQETPTDDSDSKTEYGRWIIYAIVILLLLFLLFLIIRALVTKKRKDEDDGRYKAAGSSMENPFEGYKRRETLSSISTSTGRAGDSTAGAANATIGSWDPKRTGDPGSVLGSYGRKETPSLELAADKKAPPSHKPTREKHPQERMPGAKEIAEMEQPVVMKMAYREFPMKRKTIRPLPPGISKSVGGSGAHFPIHVLDIPKHVAEIRNEGNSFVFNPLMPDYLPGISGPVIDFFGKEIIVRSKEGEEAVIVFKEYVSPLEELNKLLRSIVHRREGTDSEGKI